MDESSDLKSRIAGVVIGLLAMLIAIAILLSAAYALFYAPSTDISVLLIVFLFVLLLFVWLMSISVRLISGKRRRDGGLLSSVALIFGGLLLIALAVFSFLLDSEEQPLLVWIRPLYLSLGALGAIFLVWRRRKRNTRT